MSSSIVFSKMISHGFRESSNIACWMFPQLVQCFSQLLHHRFVTKTLHVSWAFWRPMEAAKAPLWSYPTPQRHCLNGGIHTASWVDGDNPPRSGGSRRCLTNLPCSVYFSYSYWVFLLLRICIQKKNIPSCDKPESTASRQLHVPPQQVILLLSSATSTKDIRGRGRGIQESSVVIWSAIKVC